MKTGPRPLGGKILTLPFLVLSGLVGIAFVLILWRFLVGLGPTTALSDGYPWGLWIAFDVVTGTALGCGGYAVAILCYILNKGRYHPLVRPAVLTSALGYSIAGFSVIIDLGRYWMLYGLLLPWHWNLHSVLLEVALCITLYTLVLWVELAPVFLDRWRNETSSRFHRFAEVWTPRLERVLPFLLALGLLLPTMHQSSLGSLMLVAGSKLHPLWHTAWLPLLFLISCISMGYAAVVMESVLSTAFLGGTEERGMLRRLARVMGWLLLAFLALRFADLASNGKLSLIPSNGLGALFVLEALLFLIPAGTSLLDRSPTSGRLLLSALLMILGGGLYRFDTFLVAFDPGTGWTYFPSVSETLITLGLIALEVVVYLLMVKRFPVLSGRGTRPHGA